jgi:hypothetical protein
MSAPVPALNRWRNPTFLLVFCSGALVWLAVVAWLTWRYFNPVADWIGQQHEVVQELLGPLGFLAWAVVVSFGLGGFGLLAERAAGIPSAAPTGQTHGRLSGWTPPRVPPTPPS